MKKLFGQVVLAATVALVVGCTKVEKIDVQPSTVMLDEAGKSLFGRISQKVVRK